MNYEFGFIHAVWNCSRNWTEKIKVIVNVSSPTREAETCLGTDLTLGSIVEVIQKLGKEQGANIYHFFGKREGGAKCRTKCVRYTTINN